MVRGLLVAMAAGRLLFAATATAGADVPVGPGPTQYAIQEQPPPGTCHDRAATNGDPACTPGVTNPKVTPDTLATTICRKGYTTSIRPPKAITNGEKRASAAAYGYAGSLADVEYDHLIPLALGGDPNDPRNLWIEPGASPNPKDDVESELQHRVCDGDMSLAAAQAAIVTDWTTALRAAQ